jgi:hypothetical protein
MIGLMDPFASVASPARDSFVLFDNVRVENLAPPIWLSGQATNGLGQFQLTITGALGDAFTLERSTNLAQWQAAGAVLLTNPPQAWIDPMPPAEGAFYRARR